MSKTGSINLPEEEVNACIQQLKECQLKLESLQSAIVSDLGTLRNVWGGAAENAYMDCAAKMNDCVITPMGNLLGAYANAISNGAYQLEFTDNETAKSISAQFGGITTISNVE